MAWEATVTTETGIAEGGSSAWYVLAPKEIMHVQFEREAGSGTTDDMILTVYASIDSGTTVDNEPLMAFRIGPATPMPIGTFTVTGVRSFRVTMTASGSTDTITVALKFLRDGGLAA